MNIYRENYFNNDLPIIYNLTSPYNDNDVISSACRSPLDPYVRVVGIQEPLSDHSYQLQHDLLPSNKITLKLDVSWTCHSNIIGKSGNTIKYITGLTGVSIHFPDGNKNSETQKSNQVSINSRGEELDGLEDARCYIRKLTPLIFTFALPATAQFLVPDINYSFVIAQVQLAYNVQADLHASNVGTPMILGSVKGTEEDASRVKSATLFLLQNLCGDLASLMPVQLKIEISPQHHPSILGKNSENIKRIMQITSTKIAFPQNDSNLPALAKYTVTISGAIDDVYLANQNIIGSLPLVLMFDLLPCNDVSQNEIDLIMYSLNVSIFARPKRADGRCSIIMKCAERNASNLYEAWRCLTKANKQIIRANIPVSYHIEDKTMSLFGLNNYLPRNKFTSAKETVQHNIANRHSENTRNMTDQHKIEAALDVDPYLKKSIPLHEDDNASVSNHLNSSEQPSSLSSSKSGEEDFQYIIDLIPDRRAPGCERKQLEANEVDYYARKFLAYKAMKRPVTSEPRTPTSNWVGHGFSKSMPGFVLKEEEKIEPVHDDRLLGTSWGPWAWDLKGVNFIEHLLQTLQMEQYIDVFNLKKIDLLAFSQLTAQDLQELGINLFGHRKKLLMAIKNLQDNQEKSLFERH